MMRRTLLAFSVPILIAFLPSIALAHSVTWVHEFGTLETDVARGVVSVGNDVYVDGYTDGSLPDQTSLGSADGFLRKIDASGNEVWTVQLGTRRKDLAVGLGADATGVYVAGFTNGPFPGETRFGRYDGFLQKYDVDGNLAWTTQFGTENWDEVSNVVVDASGIYVVGQTSGTFPGRTYRGGRDVFLARFELDGTMDWIREFGSPRRDLGSAVALGPAGVFVSGSTNGRLPGQAVRGGGDAFAALFTTDGGRVWIRQFGTRAGDASYAVVADGTGAYLAGYTGGTLKGQTNAGALDAFVRKLSPVDGSTIWTSQFGTDTYDEALGLGALGDRIYAIGTTLGALDGDSAGSEDAFVVAFDGTTGAESWRLQFGTAGDDWVVRASPAGDSLAVAGATWGALEGRTNAGGWDAFVAILELTP